ncbi:uncharacterized protein FOBCDRAFT_215586 [Fusarium oxysporum Fo47]|uniref:uncharacterized protein n=1 Tax=Fusarium oxysporum Fo47 TaxID=660027 RepID=UPI002869A8BA|nr:uncharacterized protein FOBCDRAFT_215586 [Fusarium oxysporum Fo47]WJG34767.1 hypothetical protein FOBCDRAFT_215586 [Fusarium oxysporum Fo47]
MSPAESHACVWCLNVLGPLVLEACLVLCNLQPTAVGLESSESSLKGPGTSLISALDLHSSCYCWHSLSNTP